MRKQVFGRKLKRDANERTDLFKGLMIDLVMRESIQTTEEKAKAIKSKIEKLITKAKIKGDKAETLLQPYLSVAAYRKVITDLAKRFEKRAGGYTRIIKLGQRFGDNAHMVIIELVDKTKTVVAPKEEEKKVAEKALVKTKVAAKSKKKETK